MNQEYAADQRDGNGYHRHQRRSQRAEEEEDDDDHDEQRLGERLFHVGDGARDVLGPVVGDLACDLLGQVLLQLVHLDADALDHVERVGVGQRPDADEHRRLAVEVDRGVVILGPEDHVGDVAQPHGRALALADHHLLELLGRAKVGVGGQVHLDQLALGLAHRRQVVVGGERLPDLGGADVERRHPVGLEPDSHGEGARAEDVRALHAVDGGEPRLDRADQVIGDLILFEELGGEAEVGGGELAVGRLDVEDRDLRLRRKIAAHLIDLGADLGQGLGGVEVEPQAGPDDGDVLLALRLDVVDAVRGGDHALERSGDEAPHQIGSGGARR